MVATLHRILGRLAGAAPRRGARLAKGGRAWRPLAPLLIALAFAQPAQAAQVQHLDTRTATAIGAGGGTPTLADVDIPSGKNRALFVWATFERDHCSPADATGGLCTSANTAGTGLGDNWPEPRIGTPPATTTNSQITARVTGPGGSLDKRNALVIGGTPSGDTRFIAISTSPTGSPPGTAFYSLSSFHIVLFENEIDTLLGGAASGTLSIAFPNVNTPSNAGDDALVSVSVFQNVEQTPTGFVRNATATAQLAAGTAGNYALAPVAYDAGQAPDEADDGKLVTAASSTTQGFATPAGHVALVGVLATANNNGTYDTPNGNLNNEPNGASGGVFFRNGGATPGSLYSLNSAALPAPLVYGGTSASFLLESDNADVGDAPVSYGNPTHTVAGIRLGAGVDADASLLNSANASGDDTGNTDDEDGVTLTPLLPVGETTVVPVSIQNASGFLNAWFDWNGDGDFADAGEQMVANQAVAVGTVDLNIAVPATALIGPTFARFRVCTNDTALDTCNTPRGTVQSGEVEDYRFTVSRKLVLRKTTAGGAGGPFAFTLTNTVQSTGTVTTATAGAPVAVDGDTASAATLAYTIVSPTTAVTIAESGLPAGYTLAGAACVDGGGATVGSLAGNTYTLTGAEVGASAEFTCTFTNLRQPRLRLQKALPNGRFAPADQFTLSIAGPGGPASVVTTGSGSTAAGVAALDPGNVGAVYTLSETAASGANLASYATTYACTNALAGGQTPSGGGTSFAVTAAAGDDLLCTFTNLRGALADLSLTKTNTPGVDGDVDQPGDSLPSGVPTSYTLTVRNAGPDAGNGAVVADTPTSGLTCSAASCTASGGASCPGATGAALYAALAGGGAAIPLLPAGGSVVIVVACTVD